MPLTHVLRRTTHHTTVRDYHTQNVLLKVSNSFKLTNDQTMQVLAYVKKLSDQNVATRRQQRAEA